MAAASSKVFEYMQLLWLNLKVKKRNLLEYLRVIYRYYFSSFLFMKTDLALISQYVLKNAFTISKQHLSEKGEPDVYAYGETPLTTLDAIVKECGLSAQDTVFELGCGRGRCCFWLRYFVGCKVVGIEIIPTFVEIADQVKASCSVDHVEFRLGDILEADFKGATVFYLYGTCYEDDFIKKLVGRFSEMASGTKVITVSYPLTDYSEASDFEVMKRFAVPFTWGEGDVYLQIKR